MIKSGVILSDVGVILSEATQITMRSVVMPAFDVIRNPPQAVPLMTKCEGLRSNRKNLNKRGTDYGRRNEKRRT